MLSFSNLFCSIDKKGNYFTYSGSPMYTLIVYSGNNQVRLMIEKCNSTHARNHRKARQAHMKKMVLNEDAFTRRFRAAKGVQTRFFSVLGPWSTRKRQVRIHFMKAWYGRFTRQKYLVRTNFFYGCFFMGPFFFSVNGAEGVIRTYYTTFKRNRPFRGFFFNFSHG